MSAAMPDPSCLTAGSLAQNGGNVVCPLHRWTYSGEGELIGAPHFACNPELNLPEQRPEDLERAAVYWPP